MVVIFLKISIILGLALAFYKIMLQQESFFEANRIYFISGILLAFSSPFIELPEIVKNQGFVSAWIQNYEQKTVPDSNLDDYGLDELYQFSDEASGVNHTAEPLPALTGKVQETPASIPSSDIKESSLPSWGFWILAIYLFGLVVFFLNLVFQLGNILFRIYRSNSKIYDGKYIIVNMVEKHAPCSFFRYIFIHPDEYDLTTYEQIIAHEKTHCRLGHSYDLILAELMVMLLWFNPLAWIFKKELEKNLEFQTDALLVKKLMFKKELYQMSLLQIAVPNKPLSITTNYNQSLLKQRIKMMNAKKSNINGYWKYAMIIPMFVGSALILNLPAISQQPATPERPGSLGPVVNPDLHIILTPPSPPLSPEQPAPQVSPAPNIQDVKAAPQAKVAPQVNLAPAVSPAPEGKLAPVVSAAPQVKSAPALSPAPAIKPAPAAKASPEVRLAPVVRDSPQLNIRNNADMSTGYWYSHIRNNEYCLEFRESRDKNYTWNVSRCFDMKLFESKGSDVFVMSRETGVLTLRGALNQEVSQGTYEFEPNPEFEKYLSSKNLEIKDRNYLFHLHLQGVNRDYIEFITGNFSDIKGSQLLAFAIHGIDRNYLDVMANAGFPDLGPQKLLAAKIHGIKPETIKEIQDLGYGDLSLDRMVELRIHKVDASYIEGLRQAGFNDLSLNQVVAAKIHKLNPESISNIRALGFGELTFNRMLELQIHKVNARYLQDLKEAGFDNLTIDQALRAKIHGVNHTFIKEAKENGYNLRTLDEYIRVKIHGMTAERTRRGSGQERMR